MRNLQLSDPYHARPSPPSFAECVRRSGLGERLCRKSDHDARHVRRLSCRDPREAINTFIAFAIPFSWIVRPEDRDRGVHLAVSPVQRIAPESVHPSVKNYHWLDLVMGLLGAYDRGANNVVLTDGAGHVVEGPGFNIFVVRNGRVATPERGMLQGITRETAMSLLADLQVVTEIRAISVEELSNADEIFITSTAGGVMPVTGLDGQTIGSGRSGPLTGRLIDAYWQAHERADWNVPIAEFAEFDPSLSDWARKSREATLVVGLPPLGALGAVRAVETKTLARAHWPRGG